MIINSCINRCCSQKSHMYRYLYEFECSLGNHCTEPCIRRNSNFTRCSRVKFILVREWLFHNCINRYYSQKSHMNNNTRCIIYWTTIKIRLTRAHGWRIKSSLVLVCGKISVRFRIRTICKHAFWVVMVEFWMNYCMHACLLCIWWWAWAKVVIKGTVLKDKRNWVIIKQGFWSISLRSRLRLNTRVLPSFWWVNVKCVIIC